MRPPVGVLAVVVASIEEQYHPASTQGGRERVDALVPPAEGDEATLALAIENLLGPLADPQIALQTGTGTAVSFVDGGVASDLAAALIGGTLLPEATVAGEGGLVVADLGEGVHYLGFSVSVALLATARTRSGWLRLRSTTASTEARDLVIDLRATTTGAETEALLVATRFVSARTVVATTEARLADGSTVPAGESVVNPMPGGAFAGRVVVLVGPGTSGPAELLALALAPLPGVTIVGEPTAGSPTHPWRVPSQRMGARYSEHGGDHCGWDSSRRRAATTRCDRGAHRE